MKALLLLLVSLLPAAAAVSGPFANGVNAPGTSGSSRAITLSASGTAGRVMVVLVAYSNGTSGALTMSVTDNATGGANTYSKLLQSTYNNGNGGQTGLFCAVETHGGATTVTVSLSASGSFLDVYAMEFAGVADCTADGTATAGASSGTTAASGAYTTTGSSDLLIGGCIAPSVSAVGNGWTLKSNTDGNGWAYKLNVAAGSQNASFTTTSGGWNCVGSALQQASGSTPPNMPPVIL